MKNFVLTALICLSIAFAATAQTDSITFAKAKWETKKIAKGIVWKHYRFDKNLFDTSENINILEINPHKKLKLILAYDKQILKPVSTFAKSANALAAINGSAFDTKKGGAVDLLKANGEVISINKLNKAGERDLHQKAALVFDKGILSIAKWDGTVGWENTLTGDILNSGPLMMYHNQMEQLDTSAFVRLRHPRTAVAITHNRVLLITIDGRNAKSRGVNLYELAKIIKWLNATDGINLDGGGSATMWIADENGVVNYPCDKKTWDHTGERTVANAVMVVR